MEGHFLKEGAKENPLSGLIDDDVFRLLDDHCLLREKGIRDYLIRRQFRQLRISQVRPRDAIERIRKNYPHLQFDTIRKIVYRFKCPPQSGR